MTATVKSPNLRRLPRICLIVLFGLVSFASSVKAQGLGRLSEVPSGTVVGGRVDSSRWNRSVLLATPRVATGDTDALSDSIRGTVSTYTLCILASVEKSTNSADDAASSPRYRIADLGAAYAMVLNERLTVVTSDGYREAGARLGLIQRRMLTTNEAQLETVEVVARSPYLWIFDTPALVHSAGKHLDLTFRHFVWIDQSSGSLATFIWLLKKKESGGYAVLKNPIRYVAEGTKEDRRIHIDGKEFTFGIPSKKAFAVEDLPPGKDIAWTTEAVKLAGQPSYRATELRNLAFVLNEALQQAKAALSPSSP